MLRLIQKGLMFGNLVEVSGETLVGRYNAALEALTGRRTNLTSFHIDLSGFAPEIGEEFGDPLYLNPNGANRRFILLSVNQAGAPLLNARFSTSRSILQRFINDNRETLFALTARDAVYGELDNSIFRVEDVADLLSIRQIHIDVDTPRGIIQAAKELEQRLARFGESPTAWAQDEELNAIIALAKTAGDVRKHTLVPLKCDYVQGNFYTTHFGGLYAFRDVKDPAVVVCDPAFKSGDWNELPMIALNDQEKLMAFFEKNGLIDNLTSNAGGEELEVLRLRMTFILMDYLAAQDDKPLPTNLGTLEFKRLVSRFYDKLPDCFHLLASVVTRLEQKASPPATNPKMPCIYYLLRAAQHADHEMINHLLARQAPMDVLFLFMFNKELFYERYANWPDNKCEYVADFLATSYLQDKAGQRQRLFMPRRTSSVPHVSAPGGKEWVKPKFFSSPWEQAKKATGKLGERLGGKLRPDGDEDAKWDDE